MAISSAIQSLLNGHTVPSSRLSSSLVDELLAEGLLTPIIHGSKQSFIARNENALRTYLYNKDDKYRLLEVTSYDSRASLAASTGNSKLLPVRACPGFPVNAYQPIQCQLRGKPFTLCPDEGSFLFIDDWVSFSVPNDVVIVGIENMENFRKIRSQQAFFEKYIPHECLLFVSRYPQSEDLHRWLQTIPNRYVHFGDFDLAGISIFLTGFYHYLGNRASFLIPDDIDTRLRCGSMERYNDHYAQYRNIHSDIPALQALIDMIHHHRRSYDQEGYITPPQTSPPTPIPSLPTAHSFWDQSP